MLQSLSFQEPGYYFHLSQCTSARYPFSFFGKKAFIENLTVCITIDCAKILSKYIKQIWEPAVQKYNHYGTPCFVHVYGLGNLSLHNDF